MPKSKKTKLREIKAVVKILVPITSPAHRGETMSDKEILETLRAKSTTIAGIKVHCIETPE